MNENDLITILKQKKRIIIYGAGMVGKLVYSRFVFYGLEKYIIGFAVSLKNEQNDLGLPIYQITELIKNKDIADVVIATLPPLHTEIMNTLHQYGFCSIWKITEELYEEMSVNYIKDAKKKYKFKKRTADIMLMASDNNSSSGAFLCLIDLSIELSKKGITNVIVLPEYGDGEDILIKKEIDFIYIPSKSWTKRAKKLISTADDKLKIENTKAICEIEQFIEDFHVKLVHNNTSYTYVGAVAAKNKNIPFVWHIRENIVEQGFSFLNNEKSINLINQSEKIIAVSKFITDSYKGLDKNKLCICYDGVNIADYYDKNKCLLNGKTVNIIQVGVITPAKNQKELIYAANILKQRNINFLIQFIGNGEAEYINALRKLIKKYSLERNVVFLGKQENIRLYYQKADIVVVCSRAEPFGRTTIEAQLSRSLIIGADAGATPELVEDGVTGLLYEKGNPKSLAEKIEYSINNVNLSRKIARNAQKYARVSYSKERNANEIVKIYKEILSLPVYTE